MAFIWSGHMDMSKQKERHGGRLFCRCEKYKKGVQTSRRLWRLQKVVSRRVCPCAFQRGSLTLETSIVLPFLLCAVTAMLYVFVMTGFQAEKYRTLTQQAQSLAVTVGQGADEGDPYTRLYAYPAHWCANCAMPPLRWIWPVAKPVWTVITSAWPPVF